MNLGRLLRLLFPNSAQYHAREYRLPFSADVVSSRLIFSCPSSSNQLTFVRQGHAVQFRSASPNHPVIPTQDSTALSCCSTRDVLSRITRHAVVAKRHTATALLNLIQFCSPLFPHDSQSEELPFLAESIPYSLHLATALSKNSNMENRYQENFLRLPDPDPSDHFI